MIQYEIFLDTDVLAAVQEQLKQMPKLTENALRIAIRRSRARLRSKIIAPPNLPTLPFVWSLDPAANARARRWYFANKVPKGSPGGRYQRTGALVEGINVTTIKDGDGDLISIGTDFDRARYVVGEQQVPSHQRTPWFELDELALEESLLLTDEVIDLWFTLADPFAGVPV